jgi:hypothetical protein
MLPLHATPTRRRKLPLQKRTQTGHLETKSKKLRGKCRLCTFIKGFLFLILVFCAPWALLGKLACELCALD